MTDDVNATVANQIFNPEPAPEPVQVEPQAPAPTTAEGAGSGQTPVAPEAQPEGFWQARYQKFLSEMNRVAPTLTAQVKDSISGKPKIQPPVEPIQPPAYQPPAEERYVSDLRPQEIQQMLRDSVKEAVNMTRQEMLTQAKVEQERQYAVDSFHSMVDDAISKGQATDGDREAAINAAASYGIDVNQPGGWTRFAQAAAKELLLTTMMKQGSTPGAAFRATDTGKVQAAMQVSQPSATAPVTNPPPQTPQQQLAANIKAVKPDSNQWMESEFKRK